MRTFRPGCWLLLLGSLLAGGSGRAFAAPARQTLLPWIQDDYPRAVALARARKVPIFVEDWAPW